MEKRTGSKLEKEYNKSVYCQHVYLTSMESTDHKLGLGLLGEISTTSDILMILL